MRYYYEISDSVLDRVDGKYLSTTIDKYRVNRQNLLWFADRVWKEGDGVLEFTKNRFTNTKELNSEELEEFVWIKLKCKHV